MAEIDPEQLDLSTEVPVVEETVIVEPAPPLAIPVVRTRRVYAGMWGPTEIGVVTAGVLALLVTTVVYFFWVVPSNREVAANKAQADRLEIELGSARSKYGKITDTETQVAKIVDSVTDFEARFLPVVATGQSALYQRLNGLISAYGLINTSGPDYAPLEAAELNSGEQTSEERGRSKLRSIYPGVYVSTTVEGSYQNIRRFIREIETGREFIVVSSIEIAPSDSDGRKEKKSNADTATTAAATTSPNAGFGGANPQAFQTGVNPVTSQNPVQAAQKGKTHGEVVSLHIELAAYFRRPGFSSLPAVK